MAPALRAGDRLLAVPVPRALVRPGDLVVVRDPRVAARRLVKRVAGRDGARAHVRGDHAVASTDSRQLGPVRLAPVVARPVYRYAPPARVGWLPAGRAAGRDQYS